MKNKKQTKKGITLALLLLAVGFAAVTTTLYINGIINLKPDKDAFEEKVIFKDVSASNGATAELDESKKVITFTTQELKNIGDSATLYYAIDNGSDVGALINGINCEPVNVSDAEDPNEDANVKNYNKYLTVTPSNALADQVINSHHDSYAVLGENVTENIVVSLARSYAGSETSNALEIKFQCQIDVDMADDVERNNDLG